jgi:hypothetical protein
MGQGRFSGIQQGFPQVAVMIGFFVTALHFLRLRESPHLYNVKIS